MNDQATKIVVDAIHGDIALTEREWRVVDTGSFQRLRHIKQLGLGHLTYPNATHTRFAHSLGVLSIMGRILAVADRKGIKLSAEQRENLRLAALLHDVGHYPYSHMMETVDTVQLIEDIAEGVSTTKRWDARRRAYPGHLRLGTCIVTNQADLIEAIGDKPRAQRVADLFGRTTAADPQLSKLINSSLDMDRLDYLLRDSNAAGVPYGHIDINYLLNSLKMSPTGMVGVSEKALPAAEQFLLARYFMYRTVYYHKTTFAFEEACRQLLRRAREAGSYDLPKDGTQVEELVASERLGTFTDAYVDRIVQRASTDGDDVLRALADAIRTRRPPKLLKEVPVLAGRHTKHHAGATLKLRCKHHIAKLAKDSGILLGQFMFCETKPLALEPRGALHTTDEARDLPPEETDELIKVFVGSDPEPKSIVDISHSLVGLCANHTFQLFRLYVVHDGSDNDGIIEKLRDQVKEWERP